MTILAAWMKSRKEIRNNLMEEGLEGKELSRALNVQLNEFLNAAEREKERQHLENLRKMGAEKKLEDQPRRLHQQKEYMRRIESEEKIRLKKELLFNDDKQKEKLDCFKKSQIDQDLIVVPIHDGIVDYSNEEEEHKKELFVFQDMNVEPINTSSLNNLTGGTEDILQIIEQNMDLTLEKDDLKDVKGKSKSIIKANDVDTEALLNNENRSKLEDANALKTSIEAFNGVPLETPDDEGSNLEELESSDELFDVDQDEDSAKEVESSSMLNALLASEFDAVFGECDVRELGHTVDDRDTDGNLRASKSDEGENNEVVKLDFEYDYIDGDADLNKESIEIEYYLIESDEDFGGKLVVSDVEYETIESNDDVEIDQKVDKTVKDL